MEQEPVSDEPKKPFANKWNPYEIRENTRAKILEILSQNPEREWSVTEMAEEVDANFQSVHIILLELVVEGKVTVRKPATYRKVYSLNMDKVVKDWVEREVKTPLFGGSL